MAENPVETWPTNLCPRTVSGARRIAPDLNARHCVLPPEVVHQAVAPMMRRLRGDVLIYSSLVQGRALMRGNLGTERWRMMIFEQDRIELERLTREMQRAAWEVNHLSVPQLIQVQMADEVVRDEIRFDIAVRFDGVPVIGRHSPG